MLGLIRQEKPVKSWQWDLAGKHPAARDFFALGPRSLVAEAFTDWIHRGAESVVAVSKETLVRSCSWRFWARTPQTGIVACGVIKNSCDSAGRPFPLLVMGSGMLDKWEKNWDLLPFACEGIWRQMEELASKNYASFELFQEDVRLLHPPQNCWKELQQEKSALATTMTSEEDDGLAALQQVNQELFLPFQYTGSYDFFTMISKIHSQLKMQEGAPPHSLFMGGLIDNPGMAFFKRPLSGQDFERMWVPGMHME